MKLSLTEQIQFVKRRLISTKPRSNLRIKLESELRNLMMRQLKTEVRQDRRERNAA